MSGRFYVTISDNEVFWMIVEHNWPPKWSIILLNYFSANLGLDNITESGEFILS